ncbi:hypothetical protein TNCV_3201281 [Trichonephila clavipes]|nr:hypothetical protein TNCV_3201281 [Trichonephila clavipes]
MMVYGGSPRPIHGRQSSRVASSANGNQDAPPSATFFPPTSDASETAPKTTPPCYILPTNQETLSHKGPSTSGQNQHLRYGMEERARSISQ